MEPLVVIAAVPQETGLLVTALEHPVRVTAGGYEYVTGTIGAAPVVVCTGGVGKVNAAAATAVMIERFRPRLVINSGCAGAYPGSGLAIGNLVVVSEEVLADDGVTVEEGWRDLRYMNLPAINQGELCCYNVLPLSRHAAEKAVQLAEVYGFALKCGRSATVSTCSGTDSYATELARRWNALIENMEGAAVAQVCLRCDTDILEIRGISNLVAARNMNTWDIPGAADAAQRFVLKYIEGIT